MTLPNYLTLDVIAAQSRAALSEDIGSGDLSVALCTPKQVTARVIARDPGVLCGQPWVNWICTHYTTPVTAIWSANDGDWLKPNHPFLTLHGQASDILTIERTLLNFIQTLSATATQTRQMVDKIRHTRAKLLDTRKTIPGLRLAQKYAVLCGGGHNHRLGLYDAILLKENHLTTLDNIESTIQRAHTANAWVEVEVETLEELRQALHAKPDRILLDNFTIDQLKEAVAITENRVPLEASGNVTDDTLVTIAETGVDFISCGALTKNIHALDLSLRFSTPS